VSALHRRCVFFFASSLTVALSDERKKGQYISCLTLAYGVHWGFLRQSEPTRPYYPLFIGFNWLPKYGLLHPPLIMASFPPLPRNSRPMLTIANRGSAANEGGGGIGGIGFIYSLKGQSFKQAHALNTLARKN
jgi:hypothetical protein